MGYRHTLNGAARTLIVKTNFRNLESDCCNVRTASFYPCLEMAKRTQNVYVEKGQTISFGLFASLLPLRLVQIRRQYS